MSPVAMIDAVSHPSKQESLYRKDMILRSHENDDVDPIDADWETTLAQHHNQSKPEPGCRQIIFKKMKLKLSCEPIDNHVKAEIFIHTEPCIFCREIRLRAAAENLVQTSNNNKPSPSRRKARWRRRASGEISGMKSTACSILRANDVMVKQIITPYLLPMERTALFEVAEFCDFFNLKDHFCLKHGNKYKPDNEIFRRPPKRRGKKKGKGNTDEYMKLGKLLDKISRDGKDPEVFCYKLDLRTRPFPAHKCDDKALNLPETPLIEDPEYGKYFHRMRKCIKCEKEADEREHAKNGFMKCGFCNRFHHFTEHKSCSTCHEVLECPKCPGNDKSNPHKCGLCNDEFCLNCRKVTTCESCGNSSCEECYETAPFEFVECSHCNYSFCTGCSSAYTCEHCGEAFCHHCREGGMLDCKCGNTVCSKCVPQKQCDICGERKCLKCYDMHGKMHCSMCKGSSCKACDGVYKCKTCHQSFCTSCRDKNHVSDCSKCKKSEKVACSHCGGQYTCTSCGKVQCRACSKSKEKCQLCGKFSCDSCGVVESCVNCGTDFCQDCKPSMERSCADCHGHLCKKCVRNPKLGGFRKCERCGDEYCTICRTTDHCDTCNVKLCSKCTTKCKVSGLVNCKTCMAKLDEFYNEIWYCATDR